MNISWSWTMLLTLSPRHGNPTLGLPVVYVAAMASTQTPYLADVEKVRRGAAE